jgi:hypothetical protein
MPWIGGYAGTQDIYMYVCLLLIHITSDDRSLVSERQMLIDLSTDNDSYHYACAGKHVVRLEVHAWDKNVSLHPGLWTSAPLSTSDLNNPPKP